MPARQRGEPYKLGKGSWGLRYYDEGGTRRRRSGFTSRTEALDWYQDIERPRQLGLPVAAPDLTFSEFVPRFLKAHEAGHEPATVWTLKVRLRRALAEFGDLTLRELERRPAEIAAWKTTLPDGARYAYVAALRQALDVAVRWGLASVNPAKLAGPNPQAKPAEVTPFTTEEVDKLAAELGPWGPLVVVAAETGLRPSEWIALERRDVDGGVLVVERSYAGGEAKPYGKTARSRRRVPLSARALAALEQVPPRLDTRLIFPAPRGGYLNLHNWRALEWLPAIEAAGLPRRRIYDLRHTFATHALAAGLSIFELARYMGTSVEMIDRTYGHLALGSEDTARAKLDAHADRLGQERATASDGEAGR